MLTNYDLEELCEEFDVPLHGIYMKDQLPKEIKNGNYMINLQSSMGGKNNGTHWTCLIVKNQNTFFYDPYGAPPSIEIRDFVKCRPNTRLGFNNWVVQDLKAENCGYFVLSFLIYVGKSSPANLFKTANEYVNRFVDNTKRNDSILKESFRKLGVLNPLLQRLYHINL